jgi:ssDNA-binding Zn-finger/Zn-ribbon topoisomerase 1
MTARKTHWNYEGKAYCNGKTDVLMDVIAHHVTCANCQKGLTVEEPKIELRKTCPKCEADVVSGRWLRWCSNHIKCRWWERITKQERDEMIRQIEEAS